MRVLILSLKSCDDSAENLTPAARACNTREHLQVRPPFLAPGSPLQLPVLRPPSSIAARCSRESDPMHLARLQGPLQRAAACSSRPFGAVLRATTTTTLEDRFAQLRIASPAAASAAVEGRRYASVKSQGAYRLKSKKTIAKKMGAKKTGGMSCSIARRQLARPEIGMPARQRGALLIRSSTS